MATKQFWQAAADRSWERFQQTEIMDWLEQDDSQVQAQERVQFIATMAGNDPVLRKEWTAICLDAAQIDADFDALVTGDVDAEFDLLCAEALFTD